MPLSNPSAERRLMHRRAIDAQVLARADGLYDVDAALTVTKTSDIAYAGGTRLAGEPIHAMHPRLVVDSQTHVLAASSQTDWMPYPGACDQHGDVFAALTGLNLMRSFRHGVQESLAGIKGRNHLSEECQVLPSAVIQAFAGVVLDAREGSADGQAPFQSDRCHALRSDGATVQTHYPRWFRTPSALTALPTAMPASTSSS